MNGLPPGTLFLGRAVGHAAAMYGDPIDEYGGIVRAAIHGRHEVPAARPVSVTYARRRALELIAESDSNQCLASDADMCFWIGAATAILRELTLDA